MNDEPLESPVHDIMSHARVRCIRVHAQSGLCPWAVHVHDNVACTVYMCQMVYGCISYAPDFPDFYRTSTSQRPPISDD